MTPFVKQAKGIGHPMSLHGNKERDDQPVQMGILGF
jgi:hypothetical protein